MLGRETELAALSDAVNAARLRQLRLVEIVGEPGHREVAPRPGASRARGRVPAARGSPVSTTRPRSRSRRSARCCAGSSGSPRPPVRAEAGQILAPFVNGAMPDLAPMAAAARSARSTPRCRHGRGGRARRGPQPRPVAPRRRLAPGAPAADADAHRRRGRALARRRVALSCCTSLTAAPAPRPWLVCLTTRPAPRSAAQGDHVLRASSSSRSASRQLLRLHSTSRRRRAVRRHDELARRACRRKSALRPRARLGDRHGEALEALPDTIERLLTARIDTLDPIDRMVLRYAAVVGPSFDLSLLGDRVRPCSATASPFAGSESSARTPLREFVVDGGENRFAFRHDLVRVTAYEGLSFGRRTEIHGRVGTAIERASGQPCGGGGRAALVPLPPGEGLRPFLALLGLGRQAGARRLRERRRSRAVRTRSRGGCGRRRARAGDGRRHRRGARRRLRALRRLLARGRTPTRRALALAPRRPRPRDAHRLEARCTARARGPLRGGHLRLRARPCPAGRSCPSEPDLATNRIELELGIAGVHYRQGRFEETITWGERAAAHASDAGDRGRLAHAYYVLANYDLGHPDGFRFCELALPIFEELHGLPRPGLDAQQPRYSLLLRGPLGGVSRLRTGGTRGAWNAQVT